MCPFPSNGHTGCCPLFSRICPCSQRCAYCRCCIALLQLLLRPLAPAVQRPHMLLSCLLPPLSLLKKVRLLMLHRAAACTVAAYTRRPCSATAARAADHPFPASAPALKGAHAAAAASRCCLLCCCLHPSPLQCNGRTCCWPAFSRLCICSKKCNRCCLQCCCCLHCCYLSPSPLQCMLMLAVHPPLPLLSKVRLPPLLFALLLQLLLTPRAPAVQWPHGLLCTLFPPLSLL